MDTAFGSLSNTPPGPAAPGEMNQHWPTSSTTRSVPGGLARGNAMSSPVAGIDPSTYHPLPLEQATALDPCMMLPYSYRASGRGMQKGDVQEGPSSAPQPNPP